MRERMGSKTGSQEVTPFFKGITLLFGAAGIQNPLKRRDSRFHGNEKSQGYGRNSKVSRRP